MKNDNSMWSTANRILSMKLAVDDDRIHENMLLLKDWLGRLASWSKHLDIVRSWPYPRLPQAAHGGVQLPDGLSEKIREHLQSCGCVFSRTIYQFLEDALLWELIRDEERISAANLPHPYEPFLDLLENGGRFSEEHGFWSIGTAALPVMLVSRFLGASDSPPMRS